MEKLANIKSQVRTGLRVTGAMLRGKWISLMGSKVFVTVDDGGRSLKPQEGKCNESLSTFILCQVGFGKDY